MPDAHTVAVFLAAGAPPEEMRLTAIVMLSLAAALAVPLAWMLRRQDESAGCTAHAVGTVVGGGHVAYGNNLIPRCAYEVGGVRYEVEGPRFESGTFAPGMRCNCTSREGLPRTFRGPAIADRLVDTRSNDGWYAMSALAALYPVGSDVDVWYDPSDPSRAYVQRPVRRYRVGIMNLRGWVIGLAALGAFFAWLAVSIA